MSSIIHYGLNTYSQSIVSCSTGEWRHLPAGLLCDNFGNICHEFFNFIHIDLNHTVIMKPRLRPTFRISRPIFKAIPELMMEVHRNISPDLLIFIGDNFYYVRSDNAK